MSQGHKLGQGHPKAEDNSRPTCKCLTSYRQAGGEPSSERHSCNANNYSNWEDQLYNPRSKDIPASPCLLSFCGMLSQLDRIQFALKGLAFVFIVCRQDCLLITTEMTIFYILIFEEVLAMSTSNSRASFLFYLQLCIYFG